MQWKRIYAVVAVSVTLSVAEGAVMADDTDRTYVMDEIVVTASNTETTMIDAPGSVSVVTEEDIQKRNIKDVDEAVRLIPGVYDLRRKGFADTAPQINIRGLWGVNRNLVMIDGQPVSEHVWRRYPLDTVERVEVVKGPFSSLYGSDAMGGVVNIITRKPKEAIELKLNTSYESYNSPLYEMMVAGRKDQWTYSFTARKRETDGYASNLSVKSASTVAEEPASGTKVTGARATTDKYGKATYLIGDTGDNFYDDRSYSFEIGRDFSDDTNVRLSYTRTDYEYGYEGGKSYLTDENGNEVTTGTAYFYDTAASSWKQISGLNLTTFESTYGGNTIDLVNVSGTTKLNGIDLRAYASWDKNDYWWVQPSLTSAYSQPSTNEKLRAEVVASALVTGRQLVTVGAEIRNVSYEMKQHSLADWYDRDSKTGMTQRLEGKTATAGAFIQDEIALIDPLTVYLGGRLDHWSSIDGYNFIIKSGTEKTYTFGDRSENNFSPRASVVYKLDATTRVKASIGQSFRGPTSSELYTGWESLSGGALKTSLPNQDLDPEKVVSGEIGLEKYFGNVVSGRVTYFHNHMSDYIYTKTFSESERTAYNLEHYGDADYYSDITQKQNIGECRSQGIEVDVTANLPYGVTTFANLTSMRTEVLENPTKPTSEGKRIPSVPETMCNAGVDYTNGGLYAGLTCRYVGDVYSADDNSDDTKGVFGGYDSYFLTDLKVSYKWQMESGFTPGLSLTCDNLFDEEYYLYYLSNGRVWGIHFDLGFGGTSL